MPDIEWPSYSESTGVTEVTTFFAGLEQTESSSDCPVLSRPSAIHVRSVVSGTVRRYKSSKAFFGRNRIRVSNKAKITEATDKQTEDSATPQSEAGACVS